MRPPLPAAPLLRGADLRCAPFFQQLSISIDSGEQVAVLGPRGSGKTALLRALTRVDAPAAGRVHFAGQDITRAWGGSLRALRRSLQFVGGDPLRTLPPNVTVNDALAEALRIHRLGSAREQREQCAALAAQFGMNAFVLSENISALSAGLRQRTALARALLLQPRLLAGDELVDRLDPAAAEPLLETLSGLCRERQAAWLWTTSNAALARRFSDRVLVLEAGQLCPG